MSRANSALQLQQQLIDLFDVSRTEFEVVTVEGVLYVKCSATLTTDTFLLNPTIMYDNSPDSLRGLRERVVSQFAGGGLFVGIMDDLHKRYYGGWDKAKVDVYFPPMKRLNLLRAWLLNVPIFIATQDAWHMRANYVCLAVTGHNTAIWYGEQPAHSD